MVDGTGNVEEERNQQASILKSGSAPTRLFILVRDEDGPHESLKHLLFEPFLSRTDIRNQSMWGSSLSVLFAPLVSQARLAPVGDPCLSAMAQRTSGRTTFLLLPSTRRAIGFEGFGITGGFAGCL
jgi:hypothetical protein